MTFNKFDEVRVAGDDFWVDEIYRENYKAYFLSEDESEDGVITLLVEHERIEPLGFTKSISNLSKYRINQGKIKITKVSGEIELSQKIFKLHKLHKRKIYGSRRIYTYKRGNNTPLPNGRHKYR